MSVLAPFFVRLVGRLATCQVFYALAPSSPRRDRRPALFVANALMQDLPDQSTQPVRDRPDGLGMAAAHCRRQAVANPGGCRLPVGCGHEAAQLVEEIENKHSFVRLCAGCRLGNGHKRERGSVRMQVEHAVRPACLMTSVGPKLRRGGAERLALDGERRDHDLSIQVVKQFALDTGPGGHTAATGRDLQLGAGPWVRPHIHFKTP